MKTRRRSFSVVDRLTITPLNTRSKNSFPIPVDLLIEIFSRLPVKSIAICRCVSKLWSSILVRPYFTELFLTVSSTRPQLLFACQKYGDLFFFSSSQSSPVCVNQLTRFDSCLEIRNHVQGLLCLIYKRISKGRSQRVAMICNPSTGQALALPKVKSRRVDVRSLLGYDPIGKKFKVLSMTRGKGDNNKMCEEHQVLTLGTRKMSWRMLECCVPHYYYPHNEICIEGVLYYTSINRSTEPETYIIVCFGVRSEKFSLVNVEETLHNAVYSGTLINYNGKFGLLVSKGFITRESTSFKLWVLEDVEKQEWSEHIYSFPPSWKDMVSCLVHFVGVTRTNEIVLSSYQTDPLYLFYFSLETNSIARVEIKGMEAFNCHITRTFVDHVENVKLM